LLNLALELGSGGAGGFGGGARGATGGCGWLLLVSLAFLLPFGLIDVDGNGNGKVEGKGGGDVEGEVEGEST
jgi:hypothetical protein